MAKQKYFFTETVDAKLRQIYAERPDSRRPGTCIGLTAYAAELGWPSGILQKRAGILGFTRIIDPPWTDAELKVLARSSHRPPSWIRERLRGRGFLLRSAPAIKTKLWRMSLRDLTGLYSADSLAEAFGVDNRTVRRWISTGLLRAGRRGTQRTLLQGGDEYLIRERDVRTFVLSNPMAIDLRKVDQLWFLDMMFEGKIGESVERVLKPKPFVRSRKAVENKKEVLAA